MANPYTGGGDMNPFADDLKNPHAPPPAAAPQPAHPAAAAAPRPVTPPHQQQFYNPSSAAEAQSGYAPTSNSNVGGQSGGDARFVQPPHNAASVPGYNGAGGSPPPQPVQHQQARDLQTGKFWRMEFYQQFFDVNTIDVLRRMGNVILPFSPPDFLQNRDWHSNPIRTLQSIDDRLSAVSSHISRNEEGEKNADLYGPFWLCTTLWITIGVVGNLFSKIEHIRQKKEGKWEYDFQVATVACIVVYAYVVTMSLLVWAIMKWKAVPAALQDVLCVYGYSMFIPFLAAILCGVPHTVFQWIVCFVSGIWSTLYLLANFWRLWSTTLNRAWFTGVVLSVIFFQLGLTLSLKFYFFNY